jgi:hypothetical protein
VHAVVDDREEDLDYMVSSCDYVFTLHTTSHNVL